MILTLAQLVAAGIQPTPARAFLEPLNRYLPDGGISTPQRVAAFLGQAIFESAGFAHLEENLFYTDATRLWNVFRTRFSSPADAAQFLRAPQRLANRVYGGRLGNGPESSGDGWAYRGRGIFQLTGKSNYEAAGKALGVDLLRHPELVAESEGAVRTAVWFWQSIDGNKWADDGLIDNITRRVNGPAMEGAKGRQDATRRALGAVS